MCSGTTSLGSSTIGSGNSGKSSSGAYSTRRSVRRGPWRLRVSERLARRNQQVVEKPRGQSRLEQPAVDPLEREVAPERELVPAIRHALGLDAGLERPQHPSIGVRDELLAGDPDLLESGAAREVAELRRGEGVHVDDRLEPLVASRIRRRGAIAR